jgi:hypothetical protein
MSDIEIAVTATRVAIQDRLNFLPRLFGKRHMLIVESTVYRFMGELSPEYHGAFWDFHTLSNDGGYLVPQGTTYAIQSLNQMFDGRVSADAARIIATLYALSHLSFSLADSGLIADRFHQLRAYAMTHPEQQAIFRVID